jgi:hypothetical protein
VWRSERHLYHFTHKGTVTYLCCTPYRAYHDDVVLEVKFCAKVLVINVCQCHFSKYFMLQCCVQYLNEIQRRFEEAYALRPDETSFFALEAFMAERMVRMTWVVVIRRPLYERLQQAKFRLHWGRGSSVFGKSPCAERLIWRAKNRM